MLRKSNLCILLSLFILFFISGCATTTIEQRDAEMQIKPLKDRISALEIQIADLTKALERERQEKQELLVILKEQEQKKQKKKQSSPKANSKTYYYFMIAIQTALKNAGFNPGLIDGRMGQRTRFALEEFQKANNLPVDGRLSKQTWELLRNYL